MHQQTGEQRGNGRGEDPHGRSDSLASHRGAEPFPVGIVRVGGEFRIAIADSENAAE